MKPSTPILHTILLLVILTIFRNSVQAHVLPTNRRIDPSLTALADVSSGTTDQLTKRHNWVFMCYTNDKFTLEDTAMARRCNKPPFRYVWYVSTLLNERWIRLTTMFIAMRKAFQTEVSHLFSRISTGPGLTARRRRDQADENMT